MSRDRVALRMRWSVDSTPDAVARVRRSAERALTRWRCPEAAVGSAVLVLSELVTNAVVHAHDAGGPVVVRAVVRPRDCIRVEVGDQSAVMPKPRRGSDEDEHGRGLMLVESFSRHWGVDEEPPGGFAKTVWAEIEWTEFDPRPPAALGDASTRASTPTPPPDPWVDAFLTSSLACR